MITCSGGCHVVDAVVAGVSFVERNWPRHPFFEDARIARAGHSGRTPYGQSLGRAPPASFAAWRELMEPWLRGTMPSP